MERQTFANQMTARGHEPATKDDITVRSVPPADHIAYIDTPTVTAITRKGATDAETLRIVAGLTA